jgi:hypothetical protein
LQRTLPKDGFALAMTHARLDHKEEAQKQFHQAMAWMKKNKPQDEELRRIYAEAASNLGSRKVEALMPDQAAPAK